MRIWAATLVLTSFWLISGLTTFKPSNATKALAENATILSQTIPQSSNAKSITVNEADFGMAKIDSEGQVTFASTLIVPFKEGNKYGWRIQLKDYKGEVTWREVLRLPKRPETWATDDGENFTVSADGLEAVTKRTESTSNGVIENFWTIAPGDPVGKHKIQVYINDRLIASFDFEIIQVGQQ